MTVIACRPFNSYHPNDHTERFYESRTNAYNQLLSACLRSQSCLDVFGNAADFEDCRKPTDLKETVNYSGNYSYVNGRQPSLYCTGTKFLSKELDSCQRLDVKVMHSSDLKQLSNESVTFPHFNWNLKHFAARRCRKDFIGRPGYRVQFCSDLSVKLVFPTKFGYKMIVCTCIAADEILHSTWKFFTIGHCRDAVLLTEFVTDVIFQVEFRFFHIYGIDFSIYLMFYKFYKTVICYFVSCVILSYAMLLFIELCNHTEFCTRVIFPAEVCTRLNVLSIFYSRVMIPNGLGAGTYRTAGRRKEGEQKGGKQKKNGNKYGRKRDGGRSRRTSQGNGSSGMEGSGEGSGNGDDSSDDDDDDDDGDDEDQDDEDDEEEGDDEEEMDTDNVSAMAEDEAEDTTNGVGEENGSCPSKVTSTTLEIHTTGIKDDVANDDDSNTMTSLIAPAEPGTPITLSGVIWKETMGGVLVVNLKWRNKTYSGSLIDHSRYGWANPRHLDEPQECDLSTASRSCKGKKGKHKESAYTGNPLSPKMSGNGKRASRFHRNKGKHNKESSTKSKTKRGSDTAEEGTRTRRRSCTVKTSVSPSPSPTPFIECPERNCNKRYKHINGLRYHQAHAHLENNDGEDKDSFDEDDMKSCDLKEPLSANSKSSGSDDVKPLSHRKAKNQKANSKTSEVSEVSPPEESVQNGEKVVETGEKFDAMDIKTEEKCDVTDIKVDEKYDVTVVKNEEKYDVIKVEPETEPMKVEESNTTTTKPQNILEEAVKIIFDEPTPDLIVPTPGIFSRMTSQAMLAASHPPAYKYVGYEAMDESVSEYSEKTEASGETQELDVTVKEEVIDEGHAGMAAKMSCKDPSEETFKLENAEMRFNGAKTGELPAEETSKTTEDEKPKWPPLEKAGKSRKGDGASVAKEQMKTSAAEIRSLPGYKHFRLPPNNNTTFLTQAKSLTLDTGLLDSKDPQKGGIPKETPRQERAGEKADGKSMVWKIQGAPSTSSASFQLTCESKVRPGYITSSRKPSVVTASNTWIPEVHHSVSNKMGGGGVPGQEVIPEKPCPPREAAEKIPRAHETGEETEDERTKVDKGDDERSKGSYSGKPARAVGVAHPFNAEKSEGEFALGMVGSITSDPMRVLYSKSSSPKMSVDINHPDMNEVKKVRVEKTLEVPVGEVVPLAKTSRTAVPTSSARGSVMVGNEIRGSFSEVRASVSDERVPQIITPSSPPREQPGYTPSSVERSSPWRPGGSHSPSREHEPRSRSSDTGQQYAPVEGYVSRKPFRRSPVPDHRSPPFRSGYLATDMGRRSPEKDYRTMDRRIPFRNIDERLVQKDSKAIEAARNSPGKDMPGSLHPPKSDSPRKDMPGSFYQRLATGYRDPERGSPFSDTLSRRQYEKSPIRDRRSPTHGRRSPVAVERASFRDTSPNPTRDGARQSPYTDRIVKHSVESEITSQRKESRSPSAESRTVEVSRGYRMKPDVLTPKEAGDPVVSQRTVGENKFPRMSEEDAMMAHARNICQYQLAAAGAQDGAAAREAMENYMMYLSRMSLPPGFDPRLIQAYPAMFTAAQMPLLLQSAKENTVSKDEKPKEVPEEIRRKTNNPKPEVPRSRETSDVEMMASKRHADRTSSSRDKTDYEPSAIKRSKTSEIKDVHEIIDDRDGGRMQLRTLEQRALQQQLKYKMDALNQLQTEKNLKMRAEEKFRSKPPSSGSSSRLKPTTQESRTVSKREDKVLPKEEKSRLSPANPPSQNSSTSDGPRTRNPESKSPGSVPTSAAPFLGFVGAPNLPANHALSNSYEQAMAMQGYPPFLMPSHFHLPPGMVMANPALVPGGQLPGAVTARSLDPKRDPTRSASSSGDRARSRDEDSQESESRNEPRDFSSKKEIGATPRINPPTPPPMDKPKEKPRGEYEEGKQRRESGTLHGTQTLPANLAYRRADMSEFAQAFPGVMYPGVQGGFRPAYDYSFMPHQRK